MGIEETGTAEQAVVIKIGLEFVQVYEFTDAETGVTYSWNATEGKRLAQAGNAEVLLVDLNAAGITKETLRILAPEVDVDRALSLPSTALLSPLLFVPHRGKHVCIDGWHRITKVVHQGVSTLPAVVLTLGEAAAIRVGGQDASS